jgi:polysaccharide export outer membrane protein
VVSHYATQTVSVLGQVRVPGGYAIATPRTILEVLALAGGVNETASRKIVIERRGSRQRVDFFLSNTPAAALDGNAMVYPGDIVFVPKADIVYVLGDVGRPGGFMNTTNNGTISALQVLALAGGTKNSAVPSHARLIRKKPDGGYSEINLSLSAMQKGRQADIPLQADDILYVPFSYLRNIAVNANTLVSSAESAAIYHF